MTTNASRAAIDFDAFERDLRQASLPEAAAPLRADPLAELARIVGQDDPFRALLAAQGTPRPATDAKQAGGSESAFFVAPQAHQETGQPAQSPADAFDQYLATVEQTSYDQSEQEEQSDPAAFDSGEGYRAPAAQRPRRPLLQVGAGLGVVALCVTGALGWKAMSGHGAGGGPVTVLADKTPLKVAPQAADGVEIPDQNKQIYERNAKDGQIKVVNREEQPLDVAQAARSASRDGKDGGTTPGNTALLTDSLGEPRRVRTVSVKPDTPVTAASQAQAQSQSQPPRAASAEPAASIPTMTLPEAAEGASPQTPAAAPRRPGRTLASTPVPAKPVQTADASGAAAPVPAAAQAVEAAPAPRKAAAQRVAAIAPETTASTSDETASAPTATASTASVGGFSVQIGVRASESDAHAAFRQMQGKYSQLSGKPELIQQADVGGKSIYRVRVGPLAKTEATGLCTELKGAGGQCFVAKN